MAFWTDIATLERAAKLVPYTFITLGFVVAASGQFVRSKIDSRIDALKEEEATAWKRTTPQMDVGLAWSVPSEELVVVIDTRNLIPFSASWTIVTENDRVVSGIMLQDQEVHPTEERKRFSIRANINGESVVNEYVELRFRYESVFASELGHPAELRGVLTRSYRLRHGRVYDWAD